RTPRRGGPTGTNGSPLWRSDSGPKHLVPAEGSSEHEKGAPFGAPDLLFCSGADDGIRTRDPNLGKVPDGRNRRRRAERTTAEIYSHLRRYRLAPAMPDGAADDSKADPCTSPCTEGVVRLMPVSSSRRSPGSGSRRAR